MEKAVLTALLVLVITGCGGSGGGASSEESVPRTEPAELLNLGVQYVLADVNLSSTTPEVTPETVAKAVEEFQADRQGYPEEVETKVDGLSVEFATEGATRCLTFTGKVTPGEGAEHTVTDEACAP